MGTCPALGDAATPSLRDQLLGFGTTPELSRAWAHGRKMALVELAALHSASGTVFGGLAALSRFQSCYCIARNCDPDSIAAAMGSPYAFVWLKRIFDLIKAKRGEVLTAWIDPHLLPKQSFGDYGSELLDRFGILVVGALCRSNATCEFAEPIPLLRPSTIPLSTRHLTPNSSSACITGVREGNVEALGVHQQELRSVTIGGRRIAIDPFDEYLFVEAREGASRQLGRDSVDDFCELLTRALSDLRANCPESIEEIQLVYRSMSPSLIASLTGFPSGTTSSSIGFSCFSLATRPEIMCEMLIHEVSHAHLFAVQNIDPLLDPAIHGEGWHPENLYSPWRDDARPINGVLHGSFVFARVAMMWLRWIDSSSTCSDLPRRRLAALRDQLVIACEILAAYATWTPAGATFFADLCRTVARIQDRCSGLQLANVEPLYAEVASVGRSSGASKSRQREHFARWRTRNPELCFRADAALATVLAN